MSLLQDKPEFCQEFRLGLVVYGGVSLAVYMNGVCREFYNAVRGRGIYKLLKALTDSDIVVDIISGTSAGGINGVLLSYALTNSTAEKIVDFKDFSGIWRNSGDINGLLRRPNPAKPPRAGKNIDSILDGEDYYQSKLIEAFETASKLSTSARELDEIEWFSPSRELDLFVTGTDTLGKVYKAFDNTGQVIEVKEHRTVFQLKYREGRKPEFQAEPVTQAALAKLCRITSCFPVAFPVVTVDLDSAPSSADYKLVQWGELLNRELPDKRQTANGWKLHFVDGGVLDNRPFSYTIREIYHRTAYRPVARKIFYIDPSPDRFLNSPSFQKMAKPSILQVAQDSLVAMPRYESIANDLKEISEHNERVRRYKFLLATVQEKLTESDSKNLASAPFDDKQPSADELVRNSRSDSDAEAIYLRCRLVGLRDRVLPFLLRMEKVVNPKSLNKKALLQQAAQQLTEYVIHEGDRQKRENLLHALGEEVRNLDVDYALRKHFFILEQICRQMTSEQGETYKKLSLLAAKICRQVELLETIQSAINRMLSLEAVSDGFCAVIEGKQTVRTSPSQESLKDKSSIRRGYVYNYVLYLHRFLLDLDQDLLQAADFQPFFESLKPWRDTDATMAGGETPEFFKQVQIQSDAWMSSTQAIAEFANKLSDRAEKLNVAENLELIVTRPQKYVFDGQENYGPTYRSLLRKIELATESLIRVSKLDDAPEGIPIKRKLLNTFRTFRQIDQEIYSYEYLADMSAKEFIEVTRISPNDAQMGLGKGKYLDDKLAGDQLRAFGGFFKKSWRSNDILWGRFDGLNRIVETLITRESLQQFSEFLGRQQAYRNNPDEYLNALIIDCLPKATPGEQKIILGYLQRLSQPGAVLAAEELKDFCNRLVMIGHRDILSSDLDSVIEDAISEQLDWNYQKIQPPTGSPPEQRPRYVPEEGYFDRAVDPFVAKFIAQDALRNLSPTDKETLFQNSYKVGSEKLLEDIPAIILRGLAARTGLILRDILVSSSVGDRVVRTYTYPVLNKVLQIYYWLIQQRSPKVYQVEGGSRLPVSGGQFLLLFAVFASAVVIVMSLVIAIFRLPVWALAAIAVLVLFIALVILRLAEPRQKKSARK